MKKIVYVVLLFVVVGTLVIFTKKNNSNELKTKEEEVMLADTSNSKNNKELIVFDLDAFIDKIPNNTEKYDYLKVAFAVQGLLNRNGPKLFYIYQRGNAENTNADSFWLRELKSTEGYIENKYNPTFEDFYKIIKLAKNEGAIKGVVLWDNNVPATSNVASTIAGVENLIPIRYDISKESCYTDLVSSGKIFTENDIKKNLVNKFVNIKTLPNEKLEAERSGISSTGSAKNDAYLWAKKYYLDTKKTNQSLLAYSRDAWSSKSKCNEDVCFVGSSVTNHMAPGHTSEVSLTILNNSNETWSKGDLFRIAAKEKNDFEIVSSEFGFEQGDNPKEARIYLEESNPISPGERVTLKFTIKAKNIDGSYHLHLGVIHDVAGWLSGEFDSRIDVWSFDSLPKNTPIYPSYKEQIGRTDLKSTEFDSHVFFSTTLNSSDYLIMKKAFFFDLSPENTAPIDDRNQKVDKNGSEDLKTLKKLLEQQSINNNHDIFTVVGFIPWYVKYSNTSDANSSLSAVQAEWLMVDIISSYGGQTDADAYSPVGLTNASIYTYSGLETSYLQKNDKENIKSGNIVKEVYDNNTIYFSMYMGDYDGSSWASSLLPKTFQGTTDKYPLAWPIAADSSNRIPHLYKWLYANQKRNDYFVASDNGTGYFNPQYRGKDDKVKISDNVLESWKNHNIKMNAKFDIDITGFLITAGREISDSVKKVYSLLTPVLVGTQIPTSSYGKTPFITYVDGGTYNKNMGKDIYNRLVESGNKFAIVRTVQLSRNDAYKAIDDIISISKNSGVKVKIVDPYTLANLYNNHPTEYKGCYTDGKNYQWVEGKTIPSGYSYVSKIGSKNACSTNSSFVKGDVDKDGNIDVKDYIIIRKYLLSLITLDNEQKEIADMNADGNIGVADYISVRKYILKLL